MNDKWPTKAEDMHIAELIMEEFAQEHNSTSLGLFELVVDENKKKMNLQLSNWVIALAQQYQSMYGAQQGEFVTRQVISRCIIQGQTLH